MYYWEIQFNNINVQNYIISYQFFVKLYYNIVYNKYGIIIILYYNNNNIILDNNISI